MAKFFLDGGEFIFQGLVFLGKRFVVFPRHHPHEPEKFLVGLREIRGGLCPHLRIGDGGVGLFGVGLFVEVIELLEKAQLLLEGLESIPGQAVQVFDLLLSLGGIEQSVSPEFEKFPVHGPFLLIF